MVNFSWSAEMSVGVPALDADHRILMRIISTLQAVEAENAGAVADEALGSLAGYARYHFAREEEVMRACGFSGLDFHKTEHAGFTRFVTRLRERYVQQADISLVDELRDHLTHWWCHHILIQDMAYKPYVLAAPSALSIPDLNPPRGQGGSGLIVLSS